MKTGFFATALAASALQFVAAAPLDAQNEPRKVKTYTTAVLEEIIYTDPAGKPVSTTFVTATIVATAAPHKHKIHAPAATDSPKKGGKLKNQNGIAYSPYHADGSCKSQDDVNEDFKQLTDYSMVRVYGVDCEQVSTVGNAAKAHDMKVFAGLYDISNLDGDIQTMIDAVNNDWSHIDTVNIGNELVNSGLNTAGEVVNAISVARGLLRAAGYTGPVVTVDTFNQIIAYPELCQASDYAAANCHAFFDADMTAEGAGAYVAEQRKAVQQACGGGKTVITESGWPSAGTANGAAVPSEANMHTAISSLQAAIPGNNLILYTAYNNMWLANNANTFNAEQYWGIYGNSATSS